jgi:hypothetical protein
MYRSTFFFLPWHYLEVSGQLHALATLPPGKEPPVLLGQEAGWTLKPVWTCRRENSWPYRDSNSNPSVIQPVASCYTNYAILAPRIFIICFENVAVSLFNLFHHHHIHFKPPLQQGCNICVIKYQCMISLINQVVRFHNMHTVATFISFRMERSHIYD